MRKLLGEKNNFAIEYNIQRCIPHLMGNVIIWLKNICIGYFQEDVLLSSIQHSLKQFKSRLNDLENKGFENLTDKEIYDLVYSGKIDNGKYLLNIGESFDDFSLFAFKKKENINFIWKLHSNPYYDYPEYNTKIHHKEISIKTFIKVVDSFQNIERFANKKLN